MFCELLVVGAVVVVVVVVCCWTLNSDLVVCSLSLSLSLSFSLSLLRFTLSLASLSFSKRYEELIAQRGILKGLANKSKYKQNQVEIQDVSRALRESTKNLCRNLKDNPNISGNLMKIQKGTFTFDI